MTGFEPAAVRSQSGCATKLRYIPLRFSLCTNIIPMIGTIVKPNPHKPNHIGLWASVSTSLKIIFKFGIILIFHHHMQGYLY